MIEVPRVATAVVVLVVAGAVVLESRVVMAPTNVLLWLILAFVLIGRPR